MNCSQLNQISLLEVLFVLGHQVVKNNEKEAWFKSPFRKETQASFKVNIRNNVWYDHGSGIGGSVVDLIVFYFKCSVKEALEWASKQKFNFSFHQQSKVISQESSSIEILDNFPIRSLSLKRYLNARKIKIGYDYIEEVHFKIKEKNLFAIGFRNDNGGYELRNQFFKGCSSKHISTIKINDSNDLILFEGFFDFLSYLQLFKLDKNVIILNSIAIVGKAKHEFKNYEKIEIYFDNDLNGKRLTQRLIKDFSNSLDCSYLYKNYKDLNDFIINKR